MNKRNVGSAFEKMAAKMLEENGLTILETNFRCKIGEIDIIAKDGQYYVFVEVKYRRNLKMGDPSFAVDYRKVKKICRVADFYRIRKGGLNDASFRFDVVTVLGNEVKWYKNAFAYVMG